MQFVRSFGLHHPERTPCGQALGVAEAHALAELMTNSPLNQQQLADRLRLQKSTISRLVSGLEQHGWLARTRDGRDGRVLNLILTEEGRRIAQQVAMARAARFQAIMQAIPASDRQQVLNALQHLVEASYDHNH